MRRALLALAIFSLLGISAAHAAEKESVYDRVLRTGVIRCGYVLYPPNTMKDPNTGRVYGIAPSIIEEIAKGLSLKVEWTEETGTASYAEALRNDRFDMLCTFGWANIPRARVLTLSRPAYFIGVHAVVAADNKKYDGNQSAINNPAVKIASVDGSSFAIVAQTLFPKATVNSHPELTDLYQPLTDVATGKADVAFAEDYALNAFMKNNPGKVRKVALDGPLQVFRTVFYFKNGEFQFADMINNALTLLQDNGTIDKILKEYETDGPAYRRVAQPYKDLP